MRVQRTYGKFKGEIKCKGHEYKRKRKCKDSRKDKGQIETIKYMAKAESTKDIDNRVGSNFYLPCWNNGMVLST